MAVSELVSHLTVNTYRAYNNSISDSEMSLYQENMIRKTRFPR